MMNTSEMRSFSEELRAFRKRKRMSQDKLAQAIGVNRQTIVAWETSRNPPKDRTRVLELAHVLDLDERETNILLAAAFLGPLPAWHLPYLRNPYFTGREDVLQRLHDTLTASKATALAQRQAISGLGGVGKTQIAVEYAYRYRDAYQGGFWVHAATRQDIIASFLGFAESFHLSKLGEQDLILAAVKQWFVTHDKWLLIFDNADDLTLAEEFLPTNDRGYVLLTTRDQALGTLATSQIVETFDTDTGTLLLLRRAKVVPPDASLDQAKPRDRSYAERIVKMMDGLPLAIDQAAAYIDETGCSLTSYLALYRQRETTLLQRRGRISKDHPLPVATTWSLSFAQVEQRNPAAADLLRVCAFLAADVIPEGLLGEGVSALGPRLADLLNQRLIASADRPGSVEIVSIALNRSRVPYIGPYQLTHLDEIVATLRQFSLIRRYPKAHVLSIHRLVQTVLQLDMDEQTRKTWAERVIRAVHQTITSVEQGRSAVGEYSLNAHDIQLMREYLLPHVLQCANLIEKYTLKLPEGPRLLTQAGSYLQRHARYAEAESLLNRASAIYEQIFGPHHSLTVQSLEDIAGLYLAWKKYTEAEQFIKRALTITEQVVGPTSLQTATCLNNLAFVCYKQGKYTEAEQHYRNSLSIKQQIHPPQYFRAYLRQKDRALHRLTKDESSSLLFKAPDLETFRKYHAIRAYILDNEMPTKLIESTMQSLVSSIVSHEILNNEPSSPPKDFSSVVPYPMLLLFLYTTAARFLNNESRISSDNFLSLAADLDAANALDAIICHIFGCDIPHDFFGFATGLNNLAILYHNQGKDAEAEPFYRLAMAMYGLMLPDFDDLDDDHLALARGYNNVAAFYKSQGMHAEAAHCYFYVFAISQRVRGFEHPKTAKALNNLAGLHESHEKYIEAEELYQRYFGVDFFGSKYSWFDQSRHKMHALQKIYERLQQKTNEQAET